MHDLFGVLQEDRSPKNAEENDPQQTRSLPLRISHSFKRVTPSRDHVGSISTQDRIKKSRSNLQQHNIPKETSLRLDARQDKDQSRGNAGSRHANGNKPFGVVVLLRVRRVLHVEKVKAVEDAGDEREDELAEADAGEEDPDAVAAIRAIGMVAPGLVHGAIDGLEDLMVVGS